MKPIEIFENLVEPLKSVLSRDNWLFLMKRGEMFISQLAEMEKEEKLIASPTVTNEQFCCDVCGCHPSILYHTPFGRFCQTHAKYS